MTSYLPAHHSSLLIVTRMGRDYRPGSRERIEQVARRVAYHGLMDQMPRKIWVAKRAKDWAPAPAYPPLRVVQFSDRYLQQGAEHHRISGVDVPIFWIPKTLADVFRNPRLVDRSVTVEGLRAALGQKKATPSAIAEAAIAADAWKIMRPYLEALTFNG